jgi:hypothetical protein
MARRAELEVRIRLEEGEWFADRKTVRRVGSATFGYEQRWADTTPITAEQALAVGEAVGKGDLVRAQLRAWARDAAELAKTQEENLVREAGVQHERLVKARERAKEARLAADVLAGPEGTPE